MTPRVASPDDMTLFKAKIFTSMYSFSMQGKHLRYPTDAFRLGPIEFSAKIFTVRRDVFKLVRIVFGRTWEHTSNKKKCEYQNEEDCCT
jgi:hypothetical protein